MIAAQCRACAETLEDHYGPIHCMECYLEIYLGIIPKHMTDTRGAKDRRTQHQRIGYKLLDQVE